MSLDIILTAVRETSVFKCNITHNLNIMAGQADLYGVIWRPEENGIETAAQLIVPLQDGLALLKAEPDRFKALNPQNGWGTYEGLISFVEAYLAACIENPDATIMAFR